MNLVLQVYLAFVRIGAMVFGGAYAAIPIVEHEVVDAQAWMTYAEFMDLLALDEITPGPILINSATFVGMRVAGIPGAVAATLGCITVPIVVALALFFILRRYKDTPIVQGVMTTLKGMAVALIASTMVKLGVAAIAPNAPAVDLAYGLYVAAVIATSFYLMHVRHVGPLPVMLGCGALNLLVAGLIM
jgi:chromate transporter